VKDLCEVLAKNTVVIEFDLSNNGIDDAAVSHVCKLIQTNKTIKKLYLENTAIYDYGAILDAMEGNRTIIDMTFGKFASEEDLDELDEILDRNEKK
jgi:hypothetical protein